MFIKYRVTTKADRFQLLDNKLVDSSLTPEDGATDVSLN